EASCVIVHMAIQERSVKPRLIAVTIYAMQITPNVWTKIKATSVGANLVTVQMSAGAMTAHLVIITAEMLYDFVTMAVLAA
ncbi:hypothetical protein LSAT2_008320, partial [Lamellibrachia satsuma]